MKVTELEVENFCRIRAINIKLGEHVTEISGQNEQGKTSTLNALWVLLDGKSVAPAKLIRTGEEYCRIRSRVGEYDITRTFRLKRDGTDITQQLRIERGNEAMPATEKFLRDLIGEHMLDPGEFISLGAKEKFDVFQQFVPNVDFRTLARQNQKDYNRRTDVKKLATTARTAAGLILLPKEVPEEEVDVASLTTELKEAGDSNLAEQERKTRRDNTVARIKELSDFAETAVRQREVLECEKAKERDRSLARLEEAMEALRKQVDETHQRFDDEMAKGASEISDKAAAALQESKELQAKIDAAPPIAEPVNTDEIVAKIKKANTDNDVVRRAAERQKHLNTAKQYEDEAKALTLAIDTRDKTKRDAIAAAKIPVEGIDFGDDEILLDGVPFDQASTARKLRVGVAIAVAKNPTLRLVWIRDASLLDDRSYQLVTDLAKEYNCQILLETVRAIGKDAIVLEDGEVVDPATENQEAAE